MKKLMTAAAALAMLSATSAHADEAPAEPFAITGTAAGDNFAGYVLEVRPSRPTAAEQEELEEEEDDWDVVSIDFAEPGG